MCCGNLVEQSEPEHYRFVKEKGTAIYQIKTGNLREGVGVMGDEQILGSSDFLNSVLTQANEAYERKTLAMAKGLGLDKLIGAVADRFEIDRDIIKSSSRQRAVARIRSIICCLAVDQLMISGVDVARQLNLSSSSVSKLASRARSDTIAKQISKDIFDL